MPKKDNIETSGYVGAGSPDLDLAIAVEMSQVAEDCLPLNSLLLILILDLFVFSFYIYIYICLIICVYIVILNY